MLYLFTALKDGKTRAGGIIVACSPSGRVADAEPLLHLGTFQTPSQAMQAAYKEARRRSGDKDPATQLLPGTSAPCYVIPWEALPVVSEAAWSEAELNAAADQLW